MNKISGSDENKKIWDFYQTAGVESFDQNGPRMRFILNQIIRNNKPAGKILNIGAGNALLEKLAKEKSLSIETLDLSSKSVKAMQEKGFIAHLGDIRETTLPDKRYSFVVASEVLEHLDKGDIPRALQEIRRLLIPGGLFIGTVPFHENLEENRMMCPSCEHHFHRWGHQTSFNLEEMKSLFENNGLKVTKIKVRTFVQWRGRGVVGFIKSLVRWILGRLGEPIASPHIYFIVHS